MEGQKDVKGEESMDGKLLMALPNTSLYEIKAGKKTFVETHELQGSRKAGAG